MEQTYTTTEAAEILGLTPARIRQLILAQVILAEKRGRDLLIPKSQVEKAKSRKTNPGPIPSGKRKIKAKNISKRA